MTNDAGRPKTEWEIGLEKVQIDATTIGYLKDKRVTSFARAIAMKDISWDRLVEESGGDLQQPDVLIISDLAWYHIHKMKEDRNYSYRNFDEWDFIQFQTNDAGTHSAGLSNTAPAPAPAPVATSMTQKSSSSKRDLKHLDECMFPNEREPITKRKWTTGSTHSASWRQHTV